MAFHEKKSIHKSTSKNGYTKVRFIDSDDEEREHLVASTHLREIHNDRDNNNNNDNDEQQLIVVTDDKSQLLIEHPSPPSAATATATTTFSNHINNHHHPVSENSHVLERPTDLFSTNRLLRNTRKMAQIGADLTGTATTQTAAPAADH